MEFSATKFLNLFFAFILECNFFGYIPIEKSLLVSFLILMIIKFKFPYVPINSLHKSENQKLRYHVNRGALCNKKANDET